eukprot:TRINITY_DN1570_c0_g1_i5.p1 TRINITY_DN1570_c0_g1~~TRINITY_DN1570_c0_g1_i5.p1  ORF type:complete len:339 (-),score=39.20 TRINITY_DN1570_c0_g1_i5:23-1012(-)
MPNSIRDGAENCEYFLKTGKCAFGNSCKYNHPPLKYVHQHQTAFPCLRIRPIPELSTPLFFPLLSLRPVTNKLTPFSLPLPDVSSPSYVPPSPFSLYRNPVREGVKNCEFYMKTGRCSFGMSCKFNHPKKNSSGPGKGRKQRKKSSGNTVSSTKTLSKSDSSGSQSKSTTSNSNKSENANEDSEKEIVDPMERDTVTWNGKIRKLFVLDLPIREGEPSCQYYMSSRKCAFGPDCKFNHPPFNDEIERNLREAALAEREKEKELELVQQQQQSQQQSQQQQQPMTVERRNRTKSSRGCFGRTRERKGIGVGPTTTTITTTITTTTTTDDS